jgi:hypothetical protein
MADLTITASAVALVESPRNPRTIPAGAAITAGMALRIDTSARAVGADGSAAGTADCIGITVTSAASAGQPVTVAGADSVVDLGDSMDALAYNALVYLSDTGTNTGTLADAAGTVSVAIGTVVPAYGATTADKLLRLSGSLRG